MSAASAPPLSVSLPPRPFRVTRSLAASGPAMLTCGSRPVTCTVAPDEAAVTTSVPAVPLTTTLSAATSPTPPTARSRFSVVTSVESRSLTVTESAPARAFRATVSTSCARVTTAPRLRVSRSSEPTADAAKTSAAAEPLNRSVSSSVPPWTMSLPSPGIPDEEIGAGAQDGRVGARVAFDGVDPGEAVQGLGEAPADQRVIAGPAVQGGALGVRERALRLVDPQAVVSETALHVDPAEPAPEEDEVRAAVVAHVDDEAPTRGRAQRDPLAGSAAGHSQRPARD